MLEWRILRTQDRLCKMSRCGADAFQLGRRVTWRRSLLLLALSLLAAPAQAGDAQDLAQAVRGYYDDGAEVASKQLLAITERLPGRDDAAWWLARCYLDLGQPEPALLLLEGRAGENIPSWRFPALEAQAALFLGQEERAASRAREAILAAPTGAVRDSLLDQARWVAAGLAVRSGDHSGALASLLELRGAPEPPLELRAALPELGACLALPLAEGVELPAPLLLASLGGWWRLPAHGGLALAVPSPQDPLLECAGPDLCTATGAPLLPQPGIRHSPSVQGERVLYAAGREPMDPEPDAPGLFRWRPGQTPVRITRAPAGAQDLLPVSGADGAVFFLRVDASGTRLMRAQLDEEPVALAPELTAIAAAVVVGDQVLVAAVHEGVSALWSLPVTASSDQPARAVLALPLEVWALRSP